MWYVRVELVCFIFKLQPEAPQDISGGGHLRLSRYVQINAFIYLSSRAFDVGLMQFERRASHTPRRAQWAIYELERGHRSFRFESSVTFLIELRVLLMRVH